MRLAYTSDLHSDLSSRNRDLVGAIAAHAAALAPDIFVVAGDVADRAADVAWTLRELAEVTGLKLYLPGNHDLFVEADFWQPDGASSRDKYERILPQVAASAGFGYLGLEPARAGALAIVGVTGWYDFSLRDPAIDVAVGLDSYRAGEWRGTRAFDRGHVFWPRANGPRAPGDHPASAAGDWAGDEEICAAMLGRLDAQLETVRDARAVVAVIHVLPFAELVVRGAFGDTPFFDAYLGSSRLGERLQREGSLRAVISGHLHRDADLLRGGIRALARPVGDARRHAGDLPAVARARVGVLEIDV